MMGNKVDFKGWAVTAFAAVALSGAWKLGGDELSNLADVSQGNNNTIYQTTVSKEDAPTAENTQSEWRLDQEL